MPEVIGDNIDRLCAIEMRTAPVEGGIPRGVLQALFSAAREFAGAPMSYLAARGLIDNVPAGRRVFVLCGSGSPPYLPFGETDGPLGGASIARALDLGLSAKPVLICEAHMMGPNRAAFGAAGLAVHLEEIFAVRPHSALAVAFPYGMERRTEIEALFDEHDPAAVVFVERTGPNAEGVFHSITGTPKQPSEVIANHLFADVARERGIFTLGIGDGGNEVGFGNIHAQARAIQRAPHAITVAQTDVLVCAAISNWGAYGVAAMLGYLLGNPGLIQDPETEYRMLAEAVKLGASDGLYTSPTMYVDGASWQTQQALVTILRELVANGLKQVRRAF
jgi:hypothetical protein